MRLSSSISAQRSFFARTDILFTGKTHIQNRLKLSDNFALHRVSGFLATNNPQGFHGKGFLAMLTNSLAKGQVGALRSSTTRMLLKTTIDSVLDSLLSSAVRANRKSNVGLIGDQASHQVDHVVSVGALLTASCLVHSYNIPYSGPSLNHIGPKYQYIRKYAKSLGF